MVGAQPDGQSVTSVGLIEHATKGHAVHGNGLHAKANDPAAILVHDYQNPVRFEEDRFGPEQVQTPKTIFRVAQEGQPGGAAMPPLWAIVAGQNATFRTGKVLIKGSQVGFKWR